MAVQYKGMDISKYQGKPDFDQVKKAGYNFVIHRVGWGQNSIDGCFNRNIQECERVGLKNGVYWFSYAYTPDMAIKEAKSCLSAISKYKITYPVCFDFEYDSVSYAVKHGVNVTKQLASDIARAFLNTVKQAGYTPCNYTNLDFSQRYFDNDVMNNYDKWAARYTTKKVDVATDAEIWQYTSKGSVPGISGNVDLDYCYKDYTSPSKPINPNTPVNPAKDIYNIPACYNLIFDYEFYLNKYPDLSAAVKQLIKSGSIPNTKESIAWWAYQHFINFGMNEARQGNSTFNPVTYRQKNPDLNAIYGDEWKAYYYHYMLAGAQEIAEGKRVPL